MGRITQYSRISHHTTSGYVGSVFTIPSTNDFTDGSWTIYDLAQSEIGVNETDKRVFIRCDDEVKEFKLTSFYTASTSGTSTFTMSQYNLGTGSVTGFEVKVRGIAETTGESYVSNLFGGLRNATGSSISFTGGTYSTQEYRDFSSGGMGGVFTLSGLTASFVINGAAGYTVSWTAQVNLY